MDYEYYKKEDTMKKYISIEQIKEYPHKYPYEITIQHGFGQIREYRVTEQRARKIANLVGYTRFYFSLDGGIVLFSEYPE